MATFPGQGGGGSVTQEALDALDVVTRNPVTGAFEVGGVVVPGALPIDWLDFIQLDWALLDGMFYRVMNVHSVGSTGGSTWMADAVGNRPVLISGPVVYTAFSDLPAAASYPGLRVSVTIAGTPCEMISRLVGSDWLWRFVGQSHPLFTIYADVAKSAPFSTEQAFTAVALPRNANTTISAVAGQCIAQPGDVFKIRASFGKTGTTDTITMYVRHGTLGTTSDTQVGATLAGSGANVTLSVDTDIQVRTATSLLMTGAATPGQWIGASSVALNAATTGLSNINTTDTFLDVCMKLTGVSDTSPLCRYMHIDLVQRGG